MVNAPERYAIVKWMPAMLVGGLVASLAAAVFVVIASRAESADRGYREHRSELTVLAGAMPSQAAAAARGDAEASEKLGASRETLERVLAEIEEGRSPFAALSSESARRLGGESGWNTLLASSQQVLAAREVATELRKSAAESRAVLGRVLAATGNAVSAPGGLPAMRVLPRFETVAQRTGDDLQQLEAAMNPAEVTQRITENTALLAQFLAGLAGADKTAGVPAIDGEAATRLAEVQNAFSEFEQSLQATLERASALAAAQRAAADLGAAADKLAKKLEAQSGAVDEGVSGAVPAKCARTLSVREWSSASYASMRPQSCQSKPYGRRFVGHTTAMSAFAE